MEWPIRSLRRIRLDIIAKLLATDDTPALRAEQASLEEVSDDFYAEQSAAIPLDYWGLNAITYDGLTFAEVAHYARVRGYEGRWAKGLFKGWRWFPLDSDGPADPEHLVPILGRSYAWNWEVAMRASAEAPGPSVPLFPRHKRRR